METLLKRPFSRDVFLTQGLQKTKTYWKFNLGLAIYKNHTENFFSWNDILSKHIDLWCISLKRSNDMNFVQKQPSRDVLRKRCSKNIQQIHRKTPALKCDYTLPWVFSCIFDAYFEIIFYKNNSGGCFSLLQKTHIIKQICKHFSN